MVSPSDRPMDPVDQTDPAAAGLPDSTEIEPADAPDAVADVSGGSTTGPTPDAADLEHAPAADADDVDHEASGGPAEHPHPDDADHGDEVPGDAAEPGDAAGAHPEPTTVAELVAATLRAAGVRIAYTVPGESFLPVLTALEDVGIRVVATRHEGAAAFAAEAHGQLTGRPAACLGTRAVGASNLAIGIHTATADSTPMFVLLGDVSSGKRGRESFQEADLAGTIGGLGVFAGRLDDAAGAPAILADAVARATGPRPGPAVLVLPEDVLEHPLVPGTAVPVVRAPAPRPEPDDVRAVLHALAGAERPVILAGGGVLRARCSNDLTRLAELLHVPVIAAWRRADVVSQDHPLFLGMAGYGAPSTVRARLDAADVILVLGTRLNEPTSFAYAAPRADQRWIHVDLVPRRHAVAGLPMPMLAIEADAKAFVRAALSRLRNAVLLAEPLARRDAHNAADRAAWEAGSAVDGGSWSGPGVHPGRVIATLRRLLPDDAILTSDAGNFSGWAARGFRYRRPGTFLGPTSGAMGYALPAAIAAAIVHRDRPVIALAGDGGFAMTMAELETAVREHARVIAIVFDNERYGTIHMHQRKRGSDRMPATDLGPVDFAAIGRAAGGRGVRVETDEAFETALRTALATDRPTVIQLALDRRWLSVDVNPGTDPALAG